MRIKFKNYIFGFLTLIIIALFIIFNILLFLASRDAMIKEKTEEYETIIKTFSNYLNRYIDEKSKEIDLLINYFQFPQRDYRKLNDLEKFLKLHQDIKYLLFINESGIVINVVPHREEIIGIDLANDPILYQENKIKFHGPHVSIIDKFPYYVLIKPFRDGKILAFIKVPGINSLIETLGAQGYYAFIVDEKGLAIAHVRQEIVNQGMNLISYYHFIKAGITGVGSFLEGEIDGIKYIFLARKIPETNLIFFIGNRYEQTMSNFYSFRKKFFYVFLAALMVIFLTSLLVSRKFSEPIQKIMQMIDRLRKGEYKFPKARSEIKEIDEISDSISKLADTLADRETKLTKIFEASKDAIVITDLNGNILDFNDAAAKMFGFKDKSDVPDEVRSDLFYYHDISDREFILDKLEEKGSIENFEVLFKKRDGTTFYGLLSSTIVKDEKGDILFIVSTIKDISEKRKLQEQLFQAQKMESIGRLSGSIAHDFNNILSVIYSSNQLIQMHSKNNPQIERYTTNIATGVEKARDFIRKLLSVSKRQPFETKVYDLNEILREEIKILRPTIREDIKIDLRTSETPLHVNIDRIQFTQIILNLTVNSMDAMPNGGEIVITTEKKSFDYEYTGKHPYVKAGNYACMSFSDTGMGIPEDIRDKIFEPFFTTKPEGTGLGLATVYGVVQQHNGFINVYSEVGRGTTFRIYFPLAEALEQKVDKDKEETEIKLRRILLVEDNDEVRSVIEEILKTNGFEVYSFSNGLEALQRYEELKDSVDLCLFDIIMPSMGGFELYRRIKTINPNVKVLFMTGYADNLFQVQTILKEGQQIIHKPFGVEELKRKIREMF